VSFPLTLILCGLGLFLLGLGHRVPALERLEARLFIKLYAFFGDERGLPVFRLFWPLGRTPVTLILLAVLLLVDLKAGLLAGGLYLPAVGLEMTLKRRMHRPRPFEALPGIEPRQPTRPLDPSFPSGDALRVWFLALVLTSVLGLAWPVSLTLLALALLVSLGRIAMGVHYPSDVLAGSGLGILAAGAFFLVLPLVS
jgi:undecaprenyl-diphosphatase